MPSFVEKFKWTPRNTTAVSVFVLILVLCQTWSMSVAAPTLPMPAPHHFYGPVFGGLPAKRSHDKVHPPAAAADWNQNGDIQQVDVDVEGLEQLKQLPNLHNIELELKEDDDKWHLSVLGTPSASPATPQLLGHDELADELRKLEQDNRGQTSNVSAPTDESFYLSSSANGKVGQLEEPAVGEEEEAEAGEDEEESVLRQPTQKQMQQEQRQIDAEIEGEIYKDRMDTVERSPASQQNEQLLHSSAMQGSNGKPHHPLRDPANTGNPHLTHSHDSNFSIIHSTSEVGPENQQEEQKELQDHSPQQNEDILNLFTNNGNRRSGGSPKTPQFPSPALSIHGRIPQLKLDKETVLRAQNGGRFSAQDLAQYIFWTGDEEGVAKAIEDLIVEGMMSRESALVFLRDIRKYGEELQGAYQDYTDSNNLSGDTMKPKFPLPSAAAAVTPVKLERQISATTLRSQVKSTPPSYSSSSSVGSNDWKNKKPIELISTENLPMLMKLNQLSTLANGQQSSATSSDPEDINGRLRLADYLYAQYSMEEVIYELAKVMFSQALINGSPAAQDSLQNFIAFVEVETKQGRISPALQTKVIDVLMLALSNTMVEHPQFFEKTKAYLEKSVSGFNGNLQAL